MRAGTGHFYHNLKMFGFDEAEYYMIVRRQLEEFRLLFRDWVASFNPLHFTVDDWGLLNPPVIPQDYLQRDDNLIFWTKMKTTNFNTISFAKLHKYCELVHQPQKFSGQKSCQYRSSSLYY